MIEHSLALPRSLRSNISIPYASGRSNRPSVASSQRPRPNGRKLPPSKLAIYRPQFDGIHDRDPQQAQNDELAPYRDQLAALHVATEAAGDQHDPGLFPEIDYSDTSLPWDE